MSALACILCGIDKDAAASEFCIEDAKKHGLTLMMKTNERHAWMDAIPQSPFFYGRSILEMAQEMGKEKP